MDEQLYGEIIEHYRAIAVGLQKLLVAEGENGHPAIMNARFNAIARLEESSMWLNNGLAFVAQMESAEKVAEEALAGKGKLEVLPGGKQ